MIRKIEEDPLLADQALFQEVMGVFRSWSVVWWLGVVGFLSERDRQQLKSWIKSQLHRFHKLSQDPDATFPFELSGGHTRETRFLLEVMIQLNQKLGNFSSFLSPKAFEAFFLKLDPKTNFPMYIVTSLPVQVESFVAGAYSERLLGDPMFKPEQVFLQGIDIGGVEEFSVHVSRTIYRIPVIQPESPVHENLSLEAESLSEIGDAGFAVDFGNANMDVESESRTDSTLEEP